MKRFIVLSALLCASAGMYAQRGDAAMPIVTVSKISVDDIHRGYEDYKGLISSFQTKRYLNYALEAVGLGSVFASPFLSRFISPRMTQVAQQSMVDRIATIRAVATRSYSPLEYGFLCLKGIALVGYECIKESIVGIGIQSVGNALGLTQSAEPSPLFKRYCAGDEIDDYAQRFPAFGTYVHQVHLPAIIDTMQGAIGSGNLDHVRAHAVLFVSSIGRLLGAYGCLADQLAASGLPGEVERIYRTVRAIQSLTNTLVSELSDEREEGNWGKINNLFLGIVSYLRGAVMTDAADINNSHVFTAWRSMSGAERESVSERQNFLQMIDASFVSQNDEQEVLEDSPAKSQAALDVGNRACELLLSEGSISKYTHRVVGVGLLVAGSALLLTYKAQFNPIKYIARRCGFRGSNASSGLSARIDDVEATLGICTPLSWKSIATTALGAIGIGGAGWQIIRKARHMLNAPCFNDVFAQLRVAAAAGAVIASVQAHDNDGILRTARQYKVVMQQFIGAIEHAIEKSTAQSWIAELTAWISGLRKNSSVIESVTPELLTDDTELDQRVGLQQALYSLWFNGSDRVDVAKRLKSHLAPELHQSLDHNIASLLSRGGITVAQFSQMYREMYRESLKILLEHLLVTQWQVPEWKERMAHSIVS